MGDALERPHFDPDEVARERATLEAEALVLHDDMFRYPTQMALSAAFGDRRYGLPVRGSEQSLGGLGASQVILGCVTDCVEETRPKFVIKVLRRDRLRV